MSKMQAQSKKAAKARPKKGPGRGAARPSRSARTGGTRARGKGLKTRRELAELLGVNMDTITSWERKGMPIAERGGRGRPSLYEIKAVRAWLHKRDTAARAETNGPLDPMQERARRDHWQATLAEQTHLVRRRVLLPAAEVERDFGGRIAAARAKFLAVPTTYTDRIARAATLEGPSGVERLLKEMVNEVLRELASQVRSRNAAA